MPKTGVRPGRQTSQNRHWLTWSVPCLEDFWWIFKISQLKMFFSEAMLRRRMKWQCGKFRKSCFSRWQSNKFWSQSTLALLLLLISASSAVLLHVSGDECCLLCSLPCFTFCFASPERIIMLDKVAQLSLHSYWLTQLWKLELCMQTSWFFLFLLLKAIHQSCVSLTSRLLLLRVVLTCLLK